MRPVPAVKNLADEDARRGRWKDWTATSFSRRSCPIEPDRAQVGELLPQGFDDLACTRRRPTLSSSSKMMSLRYWMTIGSSAPRLMRAAVNSAVRTAEPRRRVVA